MFLELTDRCDLRRCWVEDTHAETAWVVRRLFGRDEPRSTGRIIWRREGRLIDLRLEEPHRVGTEIETVVRATCARRFDFLYRHAAAFFSRRTR